ncbi:hypothetical protein AB0M28_13760 [Streptomyces sp. NPDC051940]|uniref:hypothetical protein n=1 Tax=Streptomyces sp. NPDC051940 TaxID=3155675 RepID=UPI00341FB730
MGVIGRWAECQELDRLLRRERLVAVVGPGGIGKSALVAEVVRRLAWRPGPQVRMVDFAPVSDPALVTRWLSYALRGTRAAEGGRPVLIVAETCDRVAGAVAGTLTRMVAENPRLHAVLTSRAPVDVPSQVVLGPLEFEEILRIFHLNAPRRIDDEEPVREICELLDGLPLAARVVAQQLTRRTAEDLLAELSRPENGLVMDAPEGSGPERHRTLADSLRWSLRLCTADERLLWARASVFPGTFTRAGAAEVCADERLPAAGVGHAFDGLRRRQFLVGRGEAVRMTRDVRAFGRQRLTALGEEREFQRRCIQWSLHPDTGGDAAR